jgi:hypothetical protein
MFPVRGGAVSQSLLPDSVEALKKLDYPAHSNAHPDARSSAAIAFGLILKMGVLFQKVRNTFDADTQTNPLR